MGLWHGVQYYEQKKLNEAPFYQSWPPVRVSHSGASRYLIAHLRSTRIRLCRSYLYWVIRNDTIQHLSAVDE